MWQFKLAAVRQFKFKWGAACGGKGARASCQLSECPRLQRGYQIMTGTVMPLILYLKILHLRVLYLRVLYLVVPAAGSDVNALCCNSPFTIHHSKFQISNSKFQIPNSKFQIPNSKFQIPPPADGGWLTNVCCRGICCEDRDLLGRGHPDSAECRSV